MIATLSDLWDQQPWVRLGVTVIVALLVAIVVHRAARALLWRLSHGHPMAREMLQRARAPMGWLVPILVLVLALRTRPEAAALHVAAPAGEVLVVALIATATWLGVRCIGAAEVWFNQRFPVSISNNLHARRVLTQARVLGRSATVLLILVGLAAGLMTIPGVREIGTSLLASAGVAGLAVGIAAKPVLSNLIAGLQIAITQPIRLDVVIVQGEWGRIEEITGTYVVVRIWDERRLVVPLNWFIENPFQNWTRTNAQLIGTVYLWLDYRVPLAPLREETKRLCKAAAEWDGRVCVLQVTDANEHAIQLRILASASDSGRSWDLRCRVREGLLAYVQQHYPDSLPRLRAEVAQRGDEAHAVAASGTRG